LLFAWVSHGHSKHRNLRTRTSMSAQVLQIFFRKEHLVKNRLISTLDKVIYFKRTIFCGLQNLSSLHKIGWKSAEKNLLFSNMLLLRFLWLESHTGHHFPFVNFYRAPVGQILVPPN
jgi:hypothetical protein